MIVSFTTFGQSKEKEYDTELIFDTVFISRKDFTNGKSQLVTDTIVSKPYGFVNYLVGTTILKNTCNQIAAMIDYGLYFDTVISSLSCGEFEGFEVNKTITNIEKSDTLLIVTYYYGKGCFQDILCDFEIIDDEVLDLKYIAYGAYGESGSCYSLTCFMKINKKYASKDFSKIKYVMVNGNKTTLVKLENLPVKIH